MKYMYVYTSCLKDLHIWNSKCNNSYVTSYTISASNHVPCSLEEFFDNSDVLRNGFGHFFHSIEMIKYLITYIFNYAYIATCKLRILRL